jgi:hypothetical protein
MPGLSHLLALSGALRLLSLVRTRATTEALAAVAGPEPGAALRAGQFVPGAW